MPTKDVNMRVSFIKASEQKYVLTCVRDDGTTTSAELEMRSYFKHDLMHFVVEKMIHAKFGFFGQVASGMQIEEMSPKTLKARGAHMDPQEQALEIIVATLQKTHPTQTSAPEFVQRIGEYLSQLSIVCPDFFTESFVHGALKEFNELLRQWHTLRHGGVLTTMF